MDSLTQIVLGASVGEAVLGKKIGNKAMLWGAIAGTIPDLDVLSKHFVGSIVTAHEIHRGFTHSIIFSILMSPLLAYLMKLIYKGKEANFRNWTVFFFWCLFTHPLLDAHTTWGTQLFWPWEYKLSYKNIFVIDPMYTVPFLVFTVWAMFYPRTAKIRKRLNTIGLYASCTYMLVTLAFKYTTYNVFVDSLKAQGIQYQDIETKPTPLNAILWTANVKADNGYYIGYYSLFDTSKEVKYTYYPSQLDLLKPYESHDLIKRLKKLTNNWYIARKTEQGLYFIDLRFGPSSLDEKEQDFVFKYQLIDKPDGTLEILEPKPDTKNAWKNIKDLYHRIFASL